jgi:hypothetical protein
MTFLTNFIWLHYKTIVVTLTLIAIATWATVFITLGVRLDLLHYLETRCK